ncbi:hypothetical protein BDR07DRAFT_1386499, partial [Suillus spraguei]
GCNESSIQTVVDLKAGSERHQVFTHKPARVVGALLLFRNRSAPKASENRVLTCKVALLSHPWTPATPPKVFRSRVNLTLIHTSYVSSRLVVLAVDSLILNFAIDENFNIDDEPYSCGENFTIDVYNTHFFDLHNFCLLNASQFKLDDNECHFVSHVSPSSLHPTALLMKISLNISSNDDVQAAEPGTSTASKS